MTMITPSYLGETIEYSSLHACRSTLEDPTWPVHEADLIVSLFTRDYGRVRGVAKSAMRHGGANGSGRRVKRAGNAENRVLAPLPKLQERSSREFWRNTTRTCQLRRSDGKR